MERRAYIGPRGGDPAEVEGRWGAHIEEQVPLGTVRDDAIDPEKLVWAAVDDVDDGTFDEVVAWAKERSPARVVILVEPGPLWAGTDPHPDDTIPWDGSTPVVDWWVAYR